jgi:hypothetical protein
MDNEIIAFFTVAEHEISSERSYVGAMLVTNSEGFPLEFRCTYPLKPTNIQRILYGRAIHQYIGVELCGKSLLEKIDAKPSLIIANKPFLIGLREKTDFPVICIRQGDTPDKGEVSVDISGFYPDKDRKSIKKILVSTMHGFEQEIEGKHKSIQQIISAIDPLEPFERIDKTLDEIKSKDDKFR